MILSGFFLGAAKRNGNACTGTEEQQMTIREAKEAVHATVLVGEEHLDEEILAACGSDMMSDVLAFVKDQAMLVTGLCNPQVIRTAEMIDMKCVLFVRDKNPTEEMLELAREAGIVVMKTGHRMFMSCGLLYEKGLRGGSDYERFS